MSDVLDEHFNRMRTAILKQYTAASIAKWITENTYLGGRPYSYLDHEFQEVILSDTSKDVVVIKPSQIGISEVSARMGLALVNVLRPYTVIYTLPTAHFAGTFAKTRMDPIIESSPFMRANVHKTNNNNETKQFGDSFLYIKGAASSNAPISIPADHLIHDEYDFSDQEVLGQYVSRLTHSSWKRTTKFSTPTIPGFGIAKAFAGTRRHFNFVRCSHCNHQFIPDYYKHVRIPRFTGDLREINAAALTRIRWQEAYLACPSCFREPDLSLKYREFVCENPQENFAGAGYSISPFDAPKIITVPYLVEASTRYDRNQDFVNFSLGQPAEDSEATLTREDFNNVFVSSDNEYGGSVNVMGVDVGNIYHMAVGAVNSRGQIRVIHTEQVPMGSARERYLALKKKYNVVCSVIDSQPHAETVMSLQDRDVNLYAAVYMRSKGVSTHHVVDRDDEKQEGEKFIRQVNINRNRSFDGYMEYIRSGNLQIVNSENNELIITQHMSMKRVKIFESESGEMAFTWQKTDGNDHFHHTFQYLWTASRIKGVGRPTVILPIFGAGRFSTKPKDTFLGR